MSSESLTIGAAAIEPPAEVSRAVIAVNAVGKNYQIYERPIDRLLQGLAGHRRKYYRDFWALRDITMHVHQGETVGIVGRNGSGKSTLLQMIAGTLNPTEGSIETRGRIAALLELGSGFNPDFTGLENIYLNGALLGLSRSEMDECLDEILSFADIGDFVRQPVKTYSSGMVVRLAFAVQAQVRPQILIVDEALAVGDAKFQAKCFARLKQLKDDGSAILFVTHSTEQIVNHCDRAVLIDSGKFICEGKPKDVVNRYLDLLFGAARSSVSVGKESSSEAPSSTPAAEMQALMDHRDDALAEHFHEHANFNPNEYRWGDGAARIVDFALQAGGAAYPAMIESGLEINLALRIHFLKEIHRPIVGLTIKTKEGITVYGSNSENLVKEAFGQSWSAGKVIDVTSRWKCRLAAGDNFVSVGIASRDGMEVVPHDRRYDAIHIHVSNSSFFGLADLALEMDDPVSTRTA